MADRFDEVVLLECNLDDMTAEALGYALGRVLEEGALDAWFTSIQMKKDRPATLFSVLCRPTQAATLREILLRETTTLGVRWQTMQRQVAERDTDEVQTPWGTVRRKLKLLDGRLVAAKPEYEDCARLAREHGVPIQQVMLAACNTRL
ncbi:MAG: nickel pincer cofactor biosynthesis protein LarC2 [Anaerolineae bacterium]